MAGINMLLQGVSKKIISKNISELVNSNPGNNRKKAIQTMMKRSGVDYQTAKNKQAVAIAMSKAHHKK